MKKYLVITLIILGIYNLNAQKIHSLNELEDRLTKNPKNIIIKLSTDWCGICKIQDRKIRKNKELNEILNHQIYFLEFDAESQETFEFKGIEFKPGKNKIHEFAAALLQENQSYPSWIILNSDLEIIFQHHSLMEAEDLKSILLEIINLN